MQNTPPPDDEFDTEAHELLERYLFGNTPSAEVEQFRRLREQARIDGPNLVTEILAGRLIPAPLTGPTAPPEGMEPLGFTEESPEVFPMPFSSVQFRFPRQAGKTALRELVEKAQTGHLTPEELDRANAAYQHFGDAMAKLARETIPPFLDTVRGLFQQVQTTWADIQPSIKVLEEWAADMERKPVHPKDVRDERGIKQPSPVAPFWAARPNGRRR
ncbi:hypothetical protein SEA_JIFALL16_4 [Gordonia phage Jifall16]|uniref:Uncharacterized protein n=1 Tax=Gordonia phage Foxboro TaxID=2301602 RepID=A0A385UJC8_9CAUD|nr:hypothetical protein KNU10_gp04 [Gordonia phage Foxboro]AYB69187.1 hypothetical protein SEA_FOXBORO_4 [Gordonia phage Foxboro]AYD84119.1 hypothetical protein SEA_JIFALL16_4 [Gordonia phage Jifall16]